MNVHGLLLLGILLSSFVTGLVIKLQPDDIACSRDIAACGHQKASLPTGLPKLSSSCALASVMSASSASRL